MQTSLRPAIFPLRMQSPIANMSALQAQLKPPTEPAASPDVVTLTAPAPTAVAPPSTPLPSPHPSPDPVMPPVPPPVQETVEEMIARTNREIREMQFATNAASLDASKKAIENWQTQNPWNTVSSGLPAAGAFVWALGKTLTRAQKGTLKDLIKAGIPAGYARELVERGEGDMIGYMLAHPKKKKK